MSSFEIRLIETEAFPIFAVKGYFSEDTGKALMDQVKQILKTGKVKVILDLSECMAINSMGIALLMDLALLTSDDFKGKLVLCNLNALNKKVLTVAGVIPIVEDFANVGDAVKHLSGLP